MTKAQKIKNFVEGVFDLYGFNKEGLFYYYDDKGNRIDIPLFLSNKIDHEMLEEISKRIGLTKNEILCMDNVAATKYWNKYPFYKLFKKYLSVWQWNSEFIDPKPTAEELLLNRLFGKGEGIYVRKRYNINSIQTRLIDQLKNFDSVMPGSYYENGEIKNLCFSTQEFFSFPQCSDMIRSLVEMVKNIQELFFKAIADNISEDEKLELNFLAHSLTAVDVVTPNTLITYENISVYKKVYIKEGYTDFYDYVKIKGIIKTCPWRCKEFFEDIDLVQEFINIFPQAKAAMREFAMDVSKLCCYFDWIDKDTGETLQESIEVYVPKTRKETYGWGKHINTLKRLSGPTKKGGLKTSLRTPFVLSDETFHRLQNRATAKSGGNL